MQLSDKGSERQPSQSSNRTTANVRKQCQCYFAVSVLLHGATIMEQPVAASSSYCFQEARAVYSQLAITCGTAPAGIEIRL